MTAGLQVGDPFEEGVQQGPAVSEKQLHKVLGYVQKGKDEGEPQLLPRMRESAALNPKAPFTWKLDGQS